MCVIIYEKFPFLTKKLLIVGSSFCHFFAEIMQAKNDGSL